MRIQAFAAAAVLFANMGWAQTPATPLETFDQLWRLVHMRYIRENFNGHDWNAIGARYRNKIDSTTTMEQMYTLVDDMYSELEDNHTTFLNPTRASGYSLPCLSIPNDVMSSTLVATSDLNNPEYLAPQPVVKPNAYNPKSDYGAYGVSFKQKVVVIRPYQLTDNRNPSMIRNAIKAYDNKAKGYVLDLRGNPGGALVQMVELAGMFGRGFWWRNVSRGATAVPLPTVPAFGKPNTTKSLVVLVDNNSHSAAEGLAGGLQLAKRAYVIGNTSAGNTEALTPYCTEDQAMALVAAGALAPFSGATWEGKGVVPDMNVKGSKQQMIAAIRYILKK